MRREREERTPRECKEPQTKHRAAAELISSVSCTKRVHWLGLHEYKKCSLLGAFSAVLLKLATWCRIPYLGWGGVLFSLVFERNWDGVQHVSRRPHTVSVVHLSQLLKPLRINGTGPGSMVLVAILASGGRGRAAVRLRRAHALPGQLCRCGRAWVRLAAWAVEERKSVKTEEVRSRGD